MKRVVSATDIEIAINPNGVSAQVESAIVYGLTAALKSQITIQNGRAVERNFNKFTTLQMKETPNIQVYIVPSEAGPAGIAARRSGVAGCRLLARAALLEAGFFRSRGVGRQWPQF